MAKYTTASQAGEELNLEHKEVIRRIRRGDIDASKLGWNWIIEQAEIARVKQKDWYIRLMELRAQRAAS
jgi:hypothetical protein